jgi:hypothetical protein
MAVSVVQFASSGSVSGSNSVAFGSPTTAGNRIVAIVSLDTGTSQPAGVTLTGSSDVFTLDQGAANTNPTANINLGIWSDADCTGGLTTVVSIGTSLSTLQAIFEVSGTSTSPGAAASQGGAAPASTLQAAFDSGAASSVGAGCFWVAAVTGIGSGGRAQAVPSGSWTTETALQPGGASQLLAAYQAGPGAGAPEYAGTFSGPVAGAYWAAVVAAYPPAGAIIAGAVSPLALAAPAGTVLQGAASIPGAVSPLALAAPAGTVSAGAATIFGPVAQLALAAPAGGASGSPAGRSGVSAGDYDRTSLLRKPLLW